MVPRPPRVDSPPPPPPPPPRVPLSSDERRQPDVFRLGRCYAPASTAECEAELSLERELCRKVRLNRAMLLDSGRAGDVSVTFGTPDRVEDAWAYFKKPVDSPAYARFAASVAAGAAVPAAVRRRQGLRRAEAAVKAGVAADVVALGAWEDARFGSERAGL